jgi:hypothetical protein
MNIYSRFALLTLSTILLPFVISCSTLPTDSYRYRSSSPTLYNDPVSYDNWHKQTFNQTIYPSDFYGGHYKSGGYKRSSFGNTHTHRTTPQQQYLQAGMENQRLQAEYQQQAAQAQIEQPVGWVERSETHHLRGFRWVSQALPILRARGTAF